MSSQFARESSCSLLDSDHIDTSDVQSEDECRQLCVEKKKDFAYYTYSIPGKACTCLTSGDRSYTKTYTYA